jgi:superfamily I DNA/RNA helicase
MKAPYPVTEADFAQTIEWLLRNHLPGSIAILSAVGHVSLDSLGNAHRRFFTDDDSLWSREKSTKPVVEQKGLVSTIRKFKGMDAQAVVLVNLPQDLDIPLLYTGISRAIETVVIVCPNELIKKIARRMGGQV